MIADKLSSSIPESPVYSDNIIDDNESQVIIMMRQLCYALEEDDLDNAELLLVKLDQIVTGKLFESIKLALADFDMNQAKDELIKIASTLDFCDREN